MAFPESLYTYLNNHTLIGIKGGTKRSTFLDIWMVEVNGRVFARSWNKSPNSWFTEFIKSRNGQLKYGDVILEVEGQKLDANDHTHTLIDSAYLEKYKQKENLKYAKGISQPEYADYTLELFHIARMD